MELAAAIGSDPSSPCRVTVGSGEVDLATWAGWPDGVARCMPSGRQSAGVAMGIDVEGYYRSHGAMVLRRCRRMLRDEESAVDAMHDTFVSLLRAGDRLTDEAPSSLLLRIATRVCLNRLRTQRRHPEDRDQELLHAIASAEEPEARFATRSVLRSLFGREEESTRVMAVLHYVDGLTFEEVGREVGLTAAGVRKRVSGLRARVAALVEAGALEVEP